MKLKKILSVIAYGVVPLALIATSILMPEKETFATFGEIALTLVVIILFMKPIAIIGNMMWLRRLLAYRRQLGVAAFWCALFHGVLFIYDYELYSVAHYKGWDNFLVYGAFAIVGMIILGLTSNNYALKRLKKNWKRLHYITYPTFFMALLHASMIEEELGKFFLISGAFIILKALEWSGVQLPKKS